MSAISGVSSAATSAYPAAQATKPPVKTSPNPAPAPSNLGTDSDGDNDGSGGIDVTG